MKLRGIDFGYIWNSAGSLGFFGEGYWYGNINSLFGWKPRAPGTFIAKTMTLAPTEGNMPLGSDGIQPKEFYPSCIRVWYRKGVTLNAVGLSNPGAVHLLNCGRWQERTEPFMLSFMPVAEEPDARLREVNAFVALLRGYLDDFKAPIALQLNLRCPNRPVDSTALIDECMIALSLASSLDIPVVLKFDSTLNIDAAVEISGHHACDAISVSNAVKWDDVPPEIREQYFGSIHSPFDHLGGGSVSGAAIFPLTMTWLERARNACFRCQLAIGGGILDEVDAECIIRMHSQIQAVELGVIRMLRPWKLASISEYALNVFARSGRTSFRPPDIKAAL